MIFSPMQAILLKYEFLGMVLKVLLETAKRLNKYSSFAISNSNVSQSSS